MCVIQKPSFTFEEERSMNLVVLTGRLTRDPELKNTTGGKSVVEFGLAVNEGKDKNGNDNVEFLDLTAWDKTADFIGNPEYFKKGKPITIQGRLKTDRWEDKTSGEKRSKVKVVVDRAEFALSNGSSHADAADAEDGTDEAPKPKAKPAAKGKPAPRTPQPEVSDSGDDDDDIPF